MNKNHWSKYWQQGSLTSLPQDFKENYDGEIYQYWYQFASKIPNNTVLVDICTGNGAVAFIIAEVAVKLNKSIKIMAVDAAKIDIKSVLNKYPKYQEYINHIEFISSCLIENLEDQIDIPVDYFISQYGIEYCDMEQIAQVLTNLLSAHGEINFISHTPNSDILKYMGQEEKEYQMMEDLGLFMVFKDFDKGKSKVNEFKSRISTIYKKLPVSNNSQLMFAWKNIVKQIRLRPLSQILQNKDQIIGFYLQHMSARARSKDLLHVSNKITDANWYQPLLDNKMKLVADGTIWYKSEHNAGHYYRFIKSS